MSLTSARDSELKGRLPAEVRGIRVAMARAPGAHAPWVLHGAFRMPLPDVEPIAPPVLRALVLVVDDARGTRLVAPFAARVLFADDEIRSSAHVDGAFALDVFDLLGVAPGSRAGHYHLFVALGPHVSNVVEADVVA